MRHFLAIFLLLLLLPSARAADEAATRYYNLAVASMEAGEFEQAVRDIDRALVLEPKNANYHYVKGNAALGARSYSMAESAYQEAVRLKDDFLEAHEGLGMALFRQGNLQGAKISFGKAKLLGTTNAQPFLYLGMIAFKENRINEAEKFLRDAVRRDDGLLEAHLTLGEIYLKKKKNGDAKDSFFRALKKDPNSERAHRRLGEIAYREQNWKEAIPHLRKSISVKPTSHLRFLLAKTLYENGDFKAALAPLESLRKDKAYRKRVAPLLGLAYVELGRLKEADRAFQEVLKSNPRDPNALRGRAKIALKQGKKKLAETRLKKALRVLPNDKDLRFDLGKLLYVQKRYKEAGQAFSQAARLGSGSKAYLYLARSFERQNRRADALRTYQKLLKLRPNDLEGNKELGLLYFESRKWKMALSKFEKVKSRLKTAEIYALLGRCQYQMKEYRSAAKSYGEAVRKKPEVAENHYFLGMAFWKEDQSDKALSPLDESVRRDPKAWRARSALGILLYGKGRRSEAETHLRRAVQLNQRATAARYHLGRIYMDRGQPKLAVRELKKVVRDDPKNTEASQLLGDAYTKLGKKDQALDAYGQSIQLGKASEFGKAKTKIDYGKLMLEQGQPDAAISEYKKELRGKPKSVRAWTGLGRAYGVKGRRSESERSFRKALAYAPRDPHALYYFGDSLNETGRKKEAEAIWKKYLQFHPQGNFSEKIRATLK